MFAPLAILFVLAQPVFVTTSADRPAIAAATGRELVLPGANLHVTSTDGSSVEGMVLGSLSDGSGFALYSLDREVHLHWSQIDRIEKLAPVIPVATPSIAVAPPSPAAAPSAPEFAKAGCFEIGGTLGFAAGTIRTEVDRIGTATSTGTDYALQPMLGYFSSDDLEFVLQADLIHSRKKYSNSLDDSAAAFGLSAGANWFLPLAIPFRVGPEFRIGAETKTSRARDENGNVVRIGQQGPRGLIGVTAKLPIRTGLVLSASAGYYGETFSLDVGAGLGSRSGSGTDQGLALSTGAAFLF